MIRPTYAHVDLDALESNYRAVVAHCAESGAATPCRIIGVVKANAYGHGLVPVARRLEKAGADMLACADIGEGVQLRDGGIRIPILVFGALAVGELDDVFGHDLTPTVSSPAAGVALQCAAAARGVRLHCHLKIDTGMNRLGFRHDNLRRTLPDVLASANLGFDAVYTHFATAEDARDRWFDEQRQRFEAACQALADLGCRPRMRHAANSAALVREPAARYDAVRPGLLLYGLHPPVLPRLPLRPVMTLRSRVGAVKGVRAGERVGYGSRYVAHTPTTVAIVPAGYADGVDSRLGGRGAVLVKGRRAPIVGSICMDMMTIDVTALDVEPNDEVVIIGSQGDQSIGVAEVAQSVGSISYETVCRIGSRIERVYEEPA